MNSLSILHLSDTHSQHRRLTQLPDADILVHSGDFTMNGSEQEAIDFIKKYGGKNIKFMSIIAAPEGLEKLSNAHPDIQIYCGHLDRCLNERAYICPGLGDAGDRIFGTD